MEGTFGILGMGRLGRALATALAGSGTQVVCWNRSPAVAPVGVVLLRSTAELAEAAETLLLTVSDDALPAVAAALAAERRDWSEQVVVHASGRLGAGVLEPLAARGATVAAVHPVMTFAGNAAADAARLPGIGWAVTAADGEAERRGRALAERLGGRPFAVREEDRALYHAALAHAINHLAVVAVQGVELLRLAGAGDAAAVLRPAVEAALANALALGPAAATGPLVRGDAGTVSAHVGALQAAAPEMLPAYAALARAGIAAAVEGGRLTEEQAGRLRVVLERP